MKKIVIYSIAGVAVLAIGFAVAFFLFSGKTEAKQIKTYNYDMGVFSTNIGGTKNFFKGNIIIESTDKKAETVLAEKNAILRDIILETIIQQKPEDMVSPDGMNGIKKDIIDKIKTRVGIDSIENIYFTDYIVQ
ncbi:hypothetical protein EAL2_c13570 [Peptoclostridium acidaminophilum DSM 3953]|uniref:Flagellar protein FliL n=1 Tax=Peptoclostridium acidaminophilum DSM 3953 TaxID=1286171 RepID=W8TKF6_PEPAC|nr:flagellar basal body-associated FliL family protein [Peptoclostridium acidaminophilum]AHM56652.1 hypothetical protein EAL2_c13570 [Peptoclostridium acidaminophilum DSM 3953]